MGDPGGIGPEVVVKALENQALHSQASYRIFGPAWSWEAIARTTAITGIDYAYPKSQTRPEPNSAAGELSFRMVEDAIAAAKLAISDSRRIDAIVTGPISKRAWELAGHGEFPGHTELLAARFGGGPAGMMFVSPRLRVILATAHVPLMTVGGLLTRDRIVRTIQLGDRACRQLGIASPRIAVCGLNPHAGESGLLGPEEGLVIEPAIAGARAEGIDARGPFPGDTVFNAAVRGDYDLVVAMYHDQGLIPVKLLDRDRAVNVTVGLPIVRTSPDHGTAFDIAGQGKAEAGSMKAAIELAIRMVEAARPVGEPRRG